jgi:isocitrate lyase
MKHYYAAAYPFGAGVTNASTGRMIRRIHRFATAAERDAWVYEGSPYPTDRIYRDAVTARGINAEIRRSAAAAPQGEAVWVETEDAGEVLV